MPLAQIPKFVGFVYTLVLIVVSAYLWSSGRWTRSIRNVVLLATTALGFLIFAPVMPWQLQLLTLRDEGGLGGPLGMALVGTLVVLGLTFLFGRHYCGYLCPVGAVQELAYLVPVKKQMIKQKTALSGVRWGVFVLFVAAAAVASYGLLFLFGIREFFALELGIGFAIFAAIALIGIAVYRPFCRAICPFGALASVPAMAGIYKIRRTDRCIECGKCERWCPTHEAGRDDAKGECYLCGRCMEVCPVDGALVYSRRRTDDAAKK